MLNYRLCLAFLIVSLSVTPAMAGSGRSFDHWLASFRTEAEAQGISGQTLDEALDGLTADPRVVRNDHRQPEGTTSFADYRARIVNNVRIERGRTMMDRHAETLRRISDQTGVLPQYIVALWGIETNFGENTGNYDIVRSLATLAWEGRRAKFFQSELIDALRILDMGDTDRAHLKGSWAGAMGQNQFMPSSFLKFAVDGDGDGKRDIWTNPADVFASTANYLARSGWQADQSWGRAVRIPHGLNPDLVKNKTQKTLAEWSRLGVTRLNGQPLPDDGGAISASLVAPDGMHGPTWLAYDNYRAIIKWNRSTYFATSVGLLANAIAEP